MVKIEKKLKIKKNNKLSKYNTYKDIFVFKNNFNKSIIKYVEIIKKYKILIFSSSKTLKYCIKDFYENIDDNENNTNLIDYNNNYTNYLFYNNYGEFNQPLKNSLNNLINLEQISFGTVYNKPLLKSLDNLINLKKLVLKYEFNQPFKNSLNNLINLKKITFNKEFNQQLFLPSNINILSLISNNNINLIENIPNTINELILEFDNFKLYSLPNSIKKITLNNIK